MTNLITIGVYTYGLSEDAKLDMCNKDMTQSMTDYLFQDMTNY